MESAPMRYDVNPERTSKSGIGKPPHLFEYTHGGNSIYFLMVMFSNKHTKK